MQFNLGGRAVPFEKLGKASCFLFFDDGKWRHAIRVKGGGCVLLAPDTPPALRTKVAADTTVFELSDVSIDASADNILALQADPPAHGAITADQIAVGMLISNGENAYLVISTGQGECAYLDLESGEKQNVPPHDSAICFTAWRLVYRRPHEHKLKEIFSFETQKPL